MSETRILVVEDDPNIRDVIDVALRFHGFRVTAVGTGKGALDEVSTSRPDLVVLDVMLPDVDGFEVCRRIRADGVGAPVIFLTARDTVADTVKGLTLGGDDYVTKPFSVEALVARIRAVLRRTTVPAEAERASGNLLRVADLELDEGRWEVRRGGVPVELSPTEFRLLAFLMQHAGLVLTKRQLLEEVWGYGGSSQVLETYISYLRRKLDPLGPALIHTQRGIGYSLRPPQSP
ncbi:response regulator transcription factor [Microbispora corallina]|uniref:DNA-binding response regulator n=1 Tax=Microbispora corallina TaxID=83302 RepID=A0ABQ4G5D8_9ACTN|nr:MULTISPECIES: response regulator transcription factor [Microbispora]ETK33091.1 alkaline phosphatase [Microbispora sp. ATCC PTA-5024]GIH42283.1 DNA-binding response regulator [Microbispora corallina]